MFDEFIAVSSCLRSLLHSISREQISPIYKQLQFVELTLLTTISAKSYLIRLLKPYCFQLLYQAMHRVYCFHQHRKAKNV